MLRRIVLSVIIGVVTALVIEIIGLVLVKVGVQEIGNFVKGIAPLLGFLAGLWYFLTGESPSRVV